MSGSSWRADRQRGQALPLGVLLVAVTVGVLWVVVQVGVHAQRLAMIQTAADATALAAAVAPERASEVAERNGADVIRIEERTGGVVATVRAGSVQRVAGAERPHRGSDDLAPAMVAAIGTAEAAMGRSIPIVSGYRSSAEQQWLWDHRDDNPHPVAAPGTSLHEQGLAIDVPTWFVPVLARFGPNSGVCHPLPAVDPVHFELCRMKPSR